MCCMGLGCGEEVWDWEYWCFLMGWCIFDYGWEVFELGLGWWGECVIILGMWCNIVGGYYEVIVRGNYYGLCFGIYVGFWLFWDRYNFLNMIMFLFDELL